MATLPLLVPSGVQSITGLDGTVYAPDSAGVINVDIASGNLTSLLQSGCVLHHVLYQNFTSTGTGTGTSEQTLGTYSLPANWLGQNGRGLKIRAFGVTGATANNKTMTLYFGASSIATPTAATNNKGWHLELEVHRTGLSTQVVVGRGIVDTTAVTTYNNAGTDTETAAIVIKVTGTDGTSAANDIVLKGFIVEAIW